MKVELEIPELLTEDAPQPSSQEPATEVRIDWHAWCLERRAGNEQSSWFGKHVFVFVVFFGARFLNVFGFVFRRVCWCWAAFCCVWGSAQMLCCFVSVFGCSGDAS